MKRAILSFFILSFLLIINPISIIHSQTATPPILDEEILKRIQNEVSGSICFEHIRQMTLLHREYGTKDYHLAAKYFVDKSKEYGLKEASIEKYSNISDKEGFRKYVMGYSFLWDFRGGELRMVKPYPKLITHAEYAPSTVARGSHSTDTVAELVYVGEGNSEENYKGKDVKGKLVLSYRTNHQLAVHKFGALGTIHYTNWEKYPEEDEAIHNFPVWPYRDPTKKQTFGFNISRKQGLFLRELLEKGEKVVLHAKIDAEPIQEGTIELATAIIPGSTYPDEEFIFYAHLDHPKPGAHDNASGCAVHMEVARTLSSLIQKKIIPPPKRTIRFMWVPHMSGLNMYFFHHPEKIGKVKGGCNLDCVGADPVKYPNNFYTALPPYSIPTYLTDIAINLVNYFNRKFTKGIHGGPIEDVLFSPEGSRNMFSVTLTPARGGGSDQDLAHRWPLNIPSVYFYDWPYPPRHSQINFLEYMDRTNLRRIAYLGAIISYAFATADEEMAPRLLNEINHRGKIRLDRDLLKAKNSIENSSSENINQSYIKGKKLLRWRGESEKGILDSLRPLIVKDKFLQVLYSEGKKMQKENLSASMNQLKKYYELKCQNLNIKPIKKLPKGQESQWDKVIPVHKPGMKTFPGCGTSFRYFEKVLGEKYMENYPGFMDAYRHGSKGLKDSFNYIDGKKTVTEIYDAVCAELWSGDYHSRRSISFEGMTNYLRLLKDAHVIEFKKK